MLACLFSSVKSRPLSQQSGGALWPAKVEALQEFPGPGVVLQSLTASPHSRCLSDLDDVSSWGDVSFLITAGNLS